MCVCVSLRACVYACVRRDSSSGIGTVQSGSLRVVVHAQTLADTHSHTGAMSQLRQGLADQEPFSLRLEDFGSFNQVSSTRAFFQQAGAQQAAHVHALFTSRTFTHHLLAYLHTCRARSEAT